MTDAAALPATPVLRRVDVSSQAAQARVRRRYRNEMRFRAYGLIALAVTALFLVVLMADILNRGLPAFWTHSAMLDVTLAADRIDPEGKRDPAALKAADYFPVLRDAIKGAVPGVSGRRQERMLTSLLSSGAMDPIIRKVATDPSLVGQTLKAPLLLSDDADLYLKGYETGIESRNGRGTVTVSDDGGQVTIRSSVDDFAADLQIIKQHLAQKARQMTREADRLARFADATVADRVKELRDGAAALAKRYETRSGEEELDGQLPSLLVALNGGLVKATKIDGSTMTGEVLLPLSGTSESAGGNWQVIHYKTPESNRKVSDQEVALLERMRSEGRIQRHFNWLFLTSGDSREPELAGIRGALMGTALTLLVTLTLCLPIGVFAAIYLEEFAPKNRLTDIIEININNLAAVPSIVFGLLGLAMFLNFFDLPRSAPLVGGLVLALLVLPTIIIASRASLKSVPPSIKEAALGIGASHQQAIFHHVLPLAMPGIMTGTIIGMAHALGETAPLLMIGMVAFIVDVPKSLTDAATVLPVQIFLWSDLPEQAFKAKTAGAIIILLVFLFVMNGAAIWLRRKFERRW